MKKINNTTKKVVLPSQMRASATSFFKKLNLPKKVVLPSQMRASATGITQDFTGEFELSYPLR